MIQQAQQINDVIDHLAAKLAIPASHLWDVLVRQQRYEMVAGLVWSVAWIVCAVVVWGQHARVAKWAAGDYDRGIGLVFYYVARFGSILAAVAMTVSTISRIAGILYNPEYYALTQLLDALRSAK